MTEKGNPHEILEMLARRLGDDKVLSNLLKGVDEYVSSQGEDDKEPSGHFKLPYSSDPEPVEPAWK